MPQSEDGSRGDVAESVVQGLRDKVNGKRVVLIRPRSPAM